jgi:hypothetical protein
MSETTTAAKNKTIPYWVMQLLVSQDLKYLSSLGLSISQSTEERHRDGLVN